MNESPRSQVVDRARAMELQIEPWDLVAPLRAKDLDAGRDPSFSEVIQPNVISMARKSKPGQVLDIGCGVGRLTRSLAKFGASVTGIEPSFVSAGLASAYVSDLANVDIFPRTMAQESAMGPNQYDLCVASMVLQDVVDLADLLKDAHHVTRPGGRLVVAITHPYFWPEYWGYNKESWFSYDRELFLSSEFRTSRSRSGVSTLHVHRPLHAYLDSVKKVGYQLDTVSEPMMPDRIQRRDGVSWRFPHFMFFSATAV